MSSSDSEGTQLNDLNPELNGRKVLQESIDVS